MTDPIFNDLGFRALSHGLDGLSLRQRTTANNIANIDTPGYKAQRVSFENQLQRALNFDEPEAELSLKITDQNHLGQQTASRTNLIVVDQQDNDLRNDGNNVDIDLEMTTMAETTVRFQALTQLAGMKLSLLKSIVRDSS